MRTTYNISKLSKPRRSVSLLAVHQQIYDCAATSSATRYTTGSHPLHGRRVIVQNIIADLIVMPLVLPLFLFKVLGGGGGQLGRDSEEGWSCMRIGNRLPGTPRSSALSLAHICTFAASLSQQTHPHSQSHTHTHSVSLVLVVIMKAKELKTKNSNTLNKPTTNAC